MRITVQDTILGTLPRKPKSEWKPRKAEKRKIKVTTYGRDKGSDKVEYFETTLPGGLYIEDILIWCKCSNSEFGDYIKEEDGTHGVVCANCGGVVQLG